MFSFVGCQSLRGVIFQWTITTKCQDVSFLGIIKVICNQQTYDISKQIIVSYVLSQKRKEKRR